MWVWMGKRDYNSNQMKILCMNPTCAPGNTCKFSAKITNKRLGKC